MPPWRLLKRDRQLLRAHKLYPAVVVDGHRGCVVCERGVPGAGRRRCGAQQLRARLRWPPGCSAGDRQVARSRGELPPTA